MPNGKPHDNPISDIIIHGLHPFPEDLEILIKKLYQINSEIFNKLELAPFDWERGKYISEAKILLRKLIEHNGNPNIYNKLIDEYNTEVKKAK